MDFSKNVVLKENYTFLVADSDGNVAISPQEIVPGGLAAGTELGLYDRDTRFLSRYRWHHQPKLQTLMLHSPRPDRLHSHQSLLAHHQQLLAVRRELTLSDAELRDRLVIEVTGGERREVSFELEFDADFSDLFEVRGWGRLERSIVRRVGGDGVELSYRAGDGLRLAVELSFSEPPAQLHGTVAGFRFTLAPGERRELEVRIRLHNPLAKPASSPSYDEWRQRFRGLTVPPGRRAVVERAIDDLRALLLFTEDGSVPAAGIPWFVAAFGRDALLTATMLLPWAPAVAEGTLRFLARYQGRRRGPFQAEEPGKIMHELRHGELTRTGRVPHSPYYGTVDSTPLFVVLLHRHWRATGRTELMRELQPQWEAALAWIHDEGDVDGDGFLEFTAAAPGQMLSVQSWKDSEDSMSHRDGELARGALAVSEVQGYAFDAYSAAASFYRALGRDEDAGRWERTAADLMTRFHDAFWLEELGTYAMALDGDKRPLAVLNSDAGQLLWSGIVPASAAPRLVATLFGPDSWSGWGFRTLGRGEARYNPVSYHNGSVWPHDTALIAAGLARYGFQEEAAKVRDALFDLALSQPDSRLPELVGGYRRDVRAGNGWSTEAAPPVPYPVACRPQAWDAAALIFLLSLDPSLDLSLAQPPGRG